MEGLGSREYGVFRVVVQKFVGKKILNVSGLCFLDFQYVPTLYKLSPTIFCFVINRPPPKNEKRKIEKT